MLSPRVVDEHGVEVYVGRHFPRVHHQAAEWLVPLARWRHLDRLHEAVGHDVRAHGHEAVVDWVVAAALLLPVADFRAVGGFDPRFFMNSEEVDLQRRLRERGPAVRRAGLRPPSCTRAAGPATPSAAARGWSSRAWAYADKWGGRRRLQAVLGAATATNLVWNTGRRLARRDVAPLRTARDEAALLRRRAGRTP